MENEIKAAIMKFHYSQLGQDAPFMLRASGKFEWIEGYLEPTDEELLQWKDEFESEAAAIAWIGERESEYMKEGCTEKELIVALWEKVVENRPEAANALEVKRQAVKVKIPKPE